MRHVQLKHGIASVSKGIKPETLEALDEMMRAARKQMHIKESPILFSGPMIIAILTCKNCGFISEHFPCEKCGSEDFVKSQTRRVTKKQPNEPLYLQKLYGKSPDGFAFGGRGLWTVAGPDYPDDDSDLVRCPYGAKGDLLWVRETWGAIQRYDHLPPREVPVGTSVGYKATANIGTWCQTGCDGAAGKWRPSIFMPRWASRITLEIVKVKAERLQSISDADIRAEGITEGDGVHAGSLRRAWIDGWNRINGKRTPWESNPWCFCVSFKRIAESPLK